MTQTSGPTISISPKRGLFPRRRVEELMDEPGLDAEQHRAALAGLRRINAASNAARPIAETIVRWAKQQNLSRVRILDVACGGGDVPIEVARLARERGVELDLTFVDRSATALQQASASAAAEGLVVTTAVADATQSLPAESFDVVTNSLFLHHLDSDDVIAALANMRRAGRLVVISDLRRALTGYWFAWAGCRVLSRSPIVHFDGPVSVRGAWTIDELRLMATAAGMNGVSLRRQWPFRMLLRWERHD